MRYTPCINRAELWERQYKRGNPLDLAKIVARECYAWPGGYALALVTSDGGILCAPCVLAEWRQIAQDWLWRPHGTGWLPVGIMHTGEVDEPMICDHCGKEVGE